MAELLNLFGNRGILRANLNWSICIDPDFKLTKTRNETERVTGMDKRIKNHMDFLKLNLKIDYFDQLMKECDEQETVYREKQETMIESEHRPKDIFFNKKAIYNMTNITIPEDILLGLSFGYKFLFPYVCTENNRCEILAQLDLAITQGISDLKQLGATQEICRILKQHSGAQNDEIKTWASFINLRIKNFLLKNKECFATRSDKGGHTVILSIDQYNERLANMLNEDSYEKVDGNPLEILVEKESKFINNFKKDPTMNKMFKGMPLYEPRTLTLSKFYGLIKIHKTGFPLRPITAMVGGVGYLLGKIFNTMLNQIFPTTDIHVKDSYQFVKFASEMKLKNNYRLVSFDVVSMFTSIPTSLVREIIFSKSNEFMHRFSLNRADLDSLISFLLTDCTYFTAQDMTFRQIKGLPMGSGISPTLARIVMDRVILNLLDTVKDISFIKVFVDDTIAAIDEKSIDTALHALNKFMPNQIKFTKENENEMLSINFLNVTLIRIPLNDMEGNFIIRTKWYKKNFSSGRLLNYYSSHKRTTIVATAIQFIRTILILSDPVFYNDNKQLAIQTLKENSFPETLIIKLINTYYTYMRPLTNAGGAFSFYERFEELHEQITGHHTVAPPSGQYNTDGKTKYIIFPHSVVRGREIKRIFHQNKLQNTSIAESVKNTKINSVKSIKTKTPLIASRNVILTSRCRCGDKIRICTTGFNETGLHTRKKILNKKKECDRHSHAYKQVKVSRGLFYSNQTKALLNYIHWKNRNKLDKSYRYEFPTSRLAGLIK